MEFNFDQKHKANIFDANFNELSKETLRKLEIDVNTLVKSNAPISEVAPAALKLFEFHNSRKIIILRNKLFQSIKVNDPFGAAAFARAIIEHHAVDRWLIEKSLKTINDFVRKGQLRFFEEIQRNLAKCLVGSKNTIENYNIQKKYWDKLYGQQKINLLAVVENSNDFFSNSYDFLSGIIHGTLITGCDLLGDYEKNFSLRVQSYFYSTDAIGRVYRLEPTFAFEKWTLISKLEYIKDAFDSAISDQKVANSIKIPSKLKIGKDYFGEGNAENPYQLRPGLEYFKNMYKLFDQLSFKNPKKIVADIKDGFIVDRWVSNTERILYSKIKIDIYMS